MKKSALKQIFCKSLIEIIKDIIFLTFLFLLGVAMGIIKVEHIPDGEAKLTIRIKE